MNLPPFEHFQNADHRQPIVHTNYLNVIFLHATCSIHTLVTLHKLPWKILRPIAMPVDSSAHNFRNRFWFHYQFQSKTQLPVQLQFQTLSPCTILESFEFCDVKTVTVEPQWVCVPFVHLHRLTQLTAQ
jgi:hypothetical protein